VIVMAATYPNPQTSSLACYDLHLTPINYTSVR
jgi:hypothetical protein